MTAIRPGGSSSRLPASTVLHPDLPPVCRLGLATRGNTRLGAADVLHALERGVNYWNWCAHRDGMSEAVRNLSPADRDRVVLAMQIFGTTAGEVRAHLRQALAELQTDRVEVVTLYYIESEEEWQEITGPGGAMGFLRQAREDGLIRMIGLTSHQRRLAARWAGTGLLDLLMIRYNAAHRGAERDVFPVIPERMPLVAFTCLRWGALLRPTPEDPAGLRLPTAEECYRFVLHHPRVSVALTAPDGREELGANLQILDGWAPLSAERYGELIEHGDRVHRHARPFV